MLIYLIYYGIDIVFPEHSLANKKNSASDKHYNYQVEIASELNVL